MTDGPEPTTEAPPTEDQPAVETTPAPEATSVTDDQPTSTETTEAPEGAEESFTNFRLDDVPEEHREYVEKAYKQLQADHTRKSQSLAEQRKSAERAVALAEFLDTPEGQAQIFRQLAELQGYELDDGTVTEPDEPDLSTLPLEEQLAARVDQLEQAIRAKEEAESAAAEKDAEERHLAAIDGHIDAQLNALAQDVGKPLSERYGNAVVSHALAAFPPDENGMPQIRKAYDDLEAEWKEREAQWAASKDTPHVTTSGQSASQVPDLDDDQARVQYMLDRLSPEGAGQ